MLTFVLIAAIWLAVMIAIYPWCKYAHRSQKTFFEIFHYEKLKAQEIKEKENKEDSEKEVPA